MKIQRELNQLDYFDLIKNYVRVKEMCDAYNSEHGTRVQPYECVRGDKGQVYTCHPNFTKLLAHRKEFAVAILYDEQAKQHRPAFPYDHLYDVRGFRMRAIHLPPGKLLNKNFWSWHKPQPKRTFEINGVELPCPVKQETDHYFEFGDSKFYYETEAQCWQVTLCLEKQFSNARNKE